jgi:SAM-dependent methyltransferase
MGTAYTLAYGLDITPWQTYGTNTDPAFDRLMDREELERHTPYGRAIDLGCGMGGHTRRLQERGWEVLGVDNARKAVNAAVRQGGESGRYVIGDVSYLVGSGVGQDFDLFLDVGCFHTLTDAARLRVGAGVTTLAAPSATLLMLAGPRRRNPLLPRGADLDDITTAFPDWTVLDAQAADVSGMSWMMQRINPTWYRLRLA